MGRTRFGGRPLGDAASRGPGSRASSSSARRLPVRSEEGFTLIEILLVVSILISLAAIVVVAGTTILQGTQERATRAQIERLALLIDEYRQITGTYPPDGIDSQVVNANGVALRSSAALYHALTSEIETRVMVGGIPRVVKKEALVEKFPSSEIMVAGDDYPGVVELIDAFGSPFHYDNTLDGRFQPQGGEVHYPPLDDDEHPLDPRTIEGIENGG
ncbi:MAG TPA: type II secretion system protein, partial [Planctomycetota bacterium]|nr:type II secretion system protein [Planctomycetota bacterium]